MVSQEPPTLIDCPERLPPAVLSSPVISDSKRAGGHGVELGESCGCHIVTDGEKLGQGTSHLEWTLGGGSQSLYAGEQ